MQLPAIAAARRLGCIVHVADGNSSCPGASRADRFHHIDLRDQENLVACAKTISGLQGVFTAGTDFSTSVAAVAEAMGLPGISPQVSEQATDKGRMRRVLADAGIPVPRFFTIGSSGECPSRGESLDFPVVVKPVDNMGARGVIRVESPSGLDQAVSRARGLSRRGTVIVEEFIQGQEYSLDAIVVDGAVHITGIAERHIFFPPFFVELGHTIPAKMTPREEHVLSETFREAIAALGITRGAAKGDIFLDTRGDAPRAVVGEVAARLSGGYMSGWTYPLATGVPLSEIGLRVALGESPGEKLFTPSISQVVAERALISCPGQVVSLTPPDPANLPPGVEELFLCSSPGERVAPPSNNVEKVANAIARGCDAREAEERALTALDHIDLHLAPGDEETEAFLFTPFGAGAFQRYRLKNLQAEEVSLQDIPLSWYSGDGRALCRAVAAGEPLPVIPLPENLRWERCYPVREACMVLADCLKRGLVTFEGHRGESRNGEGLAKTGGAGRLFWSAFSAAGRQGVVYLLDCLRSGRIPREFSS
ncbi:Biotin carboxylase [Alkalispirochaeta americana]|uniref:Biotin carboxylase n=2 Tax=Alkalispirochaeta americana TaxID=159291 RepID=A0A1N6PAR9_9SPIO|nr:Biotin carboxylase [Alkalispirochaeta americana]